MPPSSGVPLYIHLSKPQKHPRLHPLPERCHLPLTSLNHIHLSKPQKHPRLHPPPERCHLPLASLYTSASRVHKPFPNPLRKTVSTLTIPIFHKRVKRAHRHPPHNDLDKCVLLQQTQSLRNLPVTIPQTWTYTPPMPLPKAPPPQDTPYTHQNNTPQWH